MNLLQSLRSKFVEGAVANGENRKEVEAFWEELLGFASYSFNASHAYSYSHLSYYGAWFKANYPLEFYTAIISTEDDDEQQSIYMDDARKKDIDILPPNINESNTDFNTSDDGNIIFGFSGIKGIGNTVYDQIINLRPFYSPAHMFIKMYLDGLRINKKIFDALIKSGAMDCFGYKRSCLLAHYERLLLDFDPDKSVRKNYKTGTTEEKKEVLERIREFESLSDTYFTDPSINEFNLLEILDMEKELLGIHITGNPFDLVMGTVDVRNSVKEDIERHIEARGIFNGHVVVQVSSARHIKTRTGSNMCFLEAVDKNGSSLSLTAFSDVYDANKDNFKAGEFLLCLVSSKPSYKNDGTIDNVIRSVMDLSGPMKEASHKVSKRNKIKEVILSFDGIPNSMRVKGIINKVNAICGEADISTATARVYMQIRCNNSMSEYSDGQPGNMIMNVGPWIMNEITIDNIRGFNSLPNVIVKTR